MINYLSIQMESTFQAANKILITKKIDFETY
jgi:hypothetical protein